jgi:hypothetical protein
MPGKISCSKNLNFRISVKVNFDKVFILMALISNSHSTSKVVSVLERDLYKKMRLPATERMVFKARRPQS